MKKSNPEPNPLFDALAMLADFLAPFCEIKIFFSENNRLIQHWGADFGPMAKWPAKDGQNDKQVVKLPQGVTVKAAHRQLVCPNLGNILISVRYDVSCSVAAIQQLKTFLKDEEQEKSEVTNWHVLAEKQIEYFLNQKKMTDSQLRRMDKRELILNLHEQGLLNYKDATQWLATRLSLSRATVYNHLNWAKSVQKIHIHQVDAFSESQFAGNPAGVVLDANDLNDETMRSITRELNNAETSFVLDSQQADFQLRYFTPSGHELDFCGHSTVGALYMLAKEQRYNMHEPNAYHFNAETKAGIIKVGCTVEPDESIQVYFTAPNIDPTEYHISHETLAEVLGIPIDKVITQHKIHYEKTNKDIYLAVNNLRTLESIDVDIKRVTKFCKENNIIAICVFTTETLDRNNQFHLRCFAPAVGIPEDPFTGSVIGGLIAHAHKNKILKNTGSIGIEQGHFIGRLGTVKVKYAYRNNVYQVTIQAKASHFFSTEINLTQ